MKIRVIAALMDNLSWRPLAHKVKGYGLAIMTNADQGGALAAELSRHVQTAYEWDSLA